MERQKGNESSIWTRMQRSKQPPMDRENQTQARQVLSQDKPRTALVTSTIALHLKMVIKKTHTTKKTVDSHAHSYVTLFFFLSSWDNLGQKSKISWCARCYLLASDLKTSPNKWLLPRNLVGCQLPLKALW